LGPAPDGTRGVRRDDLTDNEPIEKHPDRGEVLLDGRWRSGVLLDVGRYDHRLNAVEFNAAFFAPSEKLVTYPRCRRKPSVRLSAKLPKII